MTRHPLRSLSAVEKAVLEAVDEQWLLGTPRNWWDPGGRVGTAAQEYMTGVLGEPGPRLDVWEIDEAELRRHPDYTSEIDREDPLGVVGRMKGEDAGPALVLNGHVDVVPPGDLERWTTPPFEMDVRGGRVYGRGVLDMKGPLVAGLAGVRAIFDSGAALRGSLLIQSVIAEEDGGLGTLASVLRGHVGDGAIVLEPTRLEVATARRGR